MTGMTRGVRPIGIGVFAAFIVVAGSLSGQPFSVSYTAGSGNDVAVTALPVPTALAAAPNPAAAGQTVTLTAMVTPHGSTPTPTGNVTFMDGATPIGIGAVNGAGVATLPTSTTLTSVVHSITAVYPGDANFVRSTSAPVILPVGTAVPVLDLRALLALAVLLGGIGVAVLRTPA